MKRILCALFAVFILVSLVGCGMSSYEDTNGAADFSLQSLTDQDILRGTVTVKTLSTTATINNKTTCTAKTMSGVETLLKREFNDERLDIIVSSEITKGNARLVLVIDDEIVHDFAVNEKNQRLTLDGVTGKVCLKLAGESAGYSVTYELG